MTCVAILVRLATIAGLILMAMLITMLSAMLRTMFIAGTTEIPGMGRLWRIDPSTAPERGMALLIAHNTRAFQSFARSLPSSPAPLATTSEAVIDEDAIDEAAIHDEARRQLDALSSKLRKTALQSLLWRSLGKLLPEQYIYVTRLVYYLADTAAPSILDKLEAVL